jgi:hypothetical protein
MDVFGPLGEDDARSVTLNESLFNSEKLITHWDALTSLRIEAGGSGTVGMNRPLSPETLKCRNAPTAVPNSWTTIQRESPSSHRNPSEANSVVAQGGADGRT